MPHSGDRRREERLINRTSQKMRIQGRVMRSSQKRKLSSLDQTSLGKDLKISRENDHEATHSRAIEDVEMKNEEDTELEDSDIVLSDDDQENHNILSSYEIERLENIKKNEMFFKELKMDEAKSSFMHITGRGQRAQRPERYGLKREKKEKEPALPRRSSLRLQRMDPMGIPLPEAPEREPQTIYEQFKTFHYNTRTASKYGLQSIEMRRYEVENRQRRSEQAISMLSCNGIEDDICEKVIQDWYDHSCKCPKRVQTALDESSFKIERYKEEISKLKIADNHAAKVVPERIFSIIMHPMQSKLLVFAGDKWGKIGIRELDSKEGQDGVFLFEPHSKPINVLNFDPSNSSKLFSCSYDGTIRCCDMQKQQFTQVYATPLDDDIMLNAFAWIARSQLMMVAKSDYTAGLVDIRTGREEQNVVAHGKSVRWIDCHPLNENYFVSACQNGSVATWDLRKMQSIKSKLSEIQCNRVVASAFYSPISGSKILLTSLDDTIRVYDVTANGNLVTTPKCLFKHNNQTGRWLTKFRARWDPRNESCFVVGNMSRPRAIDFYSTDGKGSLIGHISHDNFTSIASLNVFHPTMNVIAGGNSSGKVFVWK